MMENATACGVFRRLGVGVLTQCGAKMNGRALFIAAGTPGDNNQNHEQDRDDEDFQSASPPTMLAHSASLHGMMAEWTGGN